MVFSKLNTSRGDPVRVPPVKVIRLGGLGCSTLDLWTETQQTENDMVKPPIEELCFPWDEIGERLLTLLFIQSEYFMRHKGLIYLLKVFILNKHFIPYNVCERDNLVIPTKLTTRTPETDNYLTLKISLNFLR